MKISAAVTRAKGAPFLIEDVELEAPRPDEIVVRMVAAGICHSDMSARDQFIPIPLPIVLGHEGAGIVEAVGSAVTKLKVGDPVVLSRLTCGTCCECMGGRTNFCSHSTALNLGGRRLDGSTGLSQGGTAIAGQFFGQSSFANYALAHERNATKLDADFDLKVAPAFACGVLTGAGAIFNGMRPRVGASMVVFGAGTVGLAAMMAARVSGCATLIVVDRQQSRLDLALELGATHVLLADDTPVVPAIHAIVPGGVEYSVEATGAAPVARSAVECLKRGGECALLGVGPAQQEIAFNHWQVAIGGLSIRGFPTGISEPDALIPRLIALYRQGRFPVDRLVTYFPFENIEDAVHAAEGGTVIKPILTFG